MDNFRVKHSGGFSDINGNIYDVFIWEKSNINSGPQTIITLADEAVIIQQVPKDNLLGSKLTLKIKAKSENEYFHLYNNREGDYLIEIKSTNFRWLGVIVPGQYSENFDDPPFDVAINAVDGIGRLQEMYTDLPQIQIYGSNIWEQFMYALAKCSPILELQVLNVISPYDENGVSIYETYTTDFMFFDKNSKKKTLYEFIQEFCKTFDFYITQRNGVWMLYNEQLAVGEGDTRTFERFSLFSFESLGTTEVKVIYSANEMTYEGGTKFIIPAISTLDVTWKRDTYNVGTDSNLLNPLFKNDYEAWEWNLEVIPDDPPNLVNYTDDPPHFEEVYEEKSGVKPGQMYVIRSMLLFQIAVARFNLKSFPLLVKEEETFGISMEYFVKWAENTASTSNMPFNYNFRFKVVFENNNNETLYLKRNETSDGEGGTVYVFEWDDDDEFLEFKINYSFNNWTTSELVSALTIPEDGRIQIHIMDFFVRGFATGTPIIPSSFLNMAIHSLNLFSLNEDREKTFTESIRVQSDLYGYTEKKEIDLFYANKNEIFADGNLYQLNELDFIPGYTYKQSHEIQYLLAAKVWNQNKYPRISIDCQLHGIIPSCSIISNVPGNVEKLFQIDQIKEYNLRENKTTSIITEKNIDCEPVLMDIFNNDIKVGAKYIGCFAQPDPDPVEPTIDSHRILLSNKDGVSTIGLHVVLRRFTEDAIRIDLYSDGTSQELEIWYPNGTIRIYPFPYFNSLYLAPAQTDTPYDHIELFDSGSYEFILRSINDFGQVEIRRGLGITIT